MPRLTTDLRPQNVRDVHPPAYYRKYHEYARTHLPNWWIYDVIRYWLIPIIRVLYRLEARGTENIPASGPAIIAPNHASNTDHFFVAASMERPVRFMGKSQLFVWPIDWIISRGGVFPVCRGQSDQDALDTAIHVFKTNQVLLMYLGGGRARSGKIGDKVHRGIGHIALRTEQVIIPTAVHDSYRVREWKRGFFPKITVAFGEPMCFPINPDSTRDEEMVVAREVLKRQKELYERIEESRSGTEPPVTVVQRRIRWTVRLLIAVWLIRRKLRQPSS